MKKYYAEREQKLDSNIEFTILRHSFLRIYTHFFSENYFIKECFLWAYNDPELYLFGKIGVWDIWPFEEKIETYDESTLFSVMEFLYECVSHKTRIGYYYDTKDAMRGYRDLLNGVLKFYNGGYELSEDGQIQKLSPLCFEPLIKESIETNDPENIDSRVKYAISKFSRYNSSIEEKKEAVRTLADVLEYLGKLSIKLDNKDDSDLFKIINGFDIRHHNRTQQGDYDKDVWYDWLFYTFLASINVLLRLNDEKFDLKPQQ